MLKKMSVDVILSRVLTVVVKVATAANLSLVFVLLKLGQMIRLCWWSWKVLMRSHQKSTLSCLVYVNIVAY